MLKKILLAACLLVQSMTSQATVISYNGYERDSANNYVTGYGLDWLMWDVTKGMTLVQARAKYSGWLLADRTQVASLYSKFEFGKTNWDPLAGVIQNSNMIWTSDEASVHNLFIDMFGTTYSTGGTISLKSDPQRVARAWYGVAVDKFEIASITDDFTRDNKSQDRVGASAELLGCNHQSCGNHADYGFVLVRESAGGPVNSVSLPSSITLLTLGLVALGFRRRQSLRR